MSEIVHCTKCGKQAERAYVGVGHLYACGGTWQRAPVPDDSTGTMTHAITWNCPLCKRPGKLVPASMGDPAFWICANTNCGYLNTAPATDAPAERERVYIVASGGSMCDDYRLHAVFSTRALADAYVESASEERDGWGWNDLKIEEWDIDLSVPVEP